MEDDTITPTWCPRCGQGDIADTTCPRCALAIRTTAADELRRLSTEIETRRLALAALATQQQSVTQEYDRLLTEFHRVLAEVARPAGAPSTPTATMAPTAPKAELKPERVRDVLLWIGVALLAAAAVTFAAVAWTRYGAWGKGAILITATTVAGVVAHKLRVKLYATAEAVAALALVFALADWWGARQIGVGETWAGSTASTVGSFVMVTFAIALFALSRLRVYRAGAVLASLYLIGSLIALVPSPASETVAVLFACASAAVVLAMAWRELRDPAECRELLLLGAGVYWLIGFGGVLISMGHDGALVPIATASLALAPIAMRVVWSDKLDDAGGDFLIGVGAFMLVLVPTVALRHFDATTQVLATALAAAVGVAAATAAPRIVRGGLSGAGLLGATLAGLALLPEVLSATFGPLGRSGVFNGHASDSLRSLVAQRDMINPAAIATLAVIALTATALARVAERSSLTWLKIPMSPIVVAVATLIVPLVLVYADATVGVALGVDLAIVAASIIGAATFECRSHTRISTLAAIPGITVAASVLGLAMTTRPMAVTSAAIATAAFLAITMISRADNTRLTGALIGGAGLWGTIALALLRGPH